MSISDIGRRAPEALQLYMLTTGGSIKRQEEDAQRSPTTMVAYCLNSGSKALSIPKQTSVSLYMGIVGPTCGQ